MGNSQPQQTKPKPLNPAELQTYLMVTQVKLNQGRNKKIALIKRKYDEIVKHLTENNLDISKAKMESLMREEDYITIYDILGPLCEILKEKVTYIMTSKECPLDLRASLDTLVYSSTRLEIDELHMVREFIKTKYTNIYIDKANSNVDKLVNINVVDKLTVKPYPEPELISRLQAICEKENINFNFPQIINPFEVKNNPVQENPNIPNPNYPMYDIYPQSYQDYNPQQNNQFNPQYNQGFNPQQNNQGFSNPPFDQGQNNFNNFPNNFSNQQQDNFNLPNTQQNPNNFNQQIPPMYNNSFPQMGNNFPQPQQNNESPMMGGGFPPMNTQSPNNNFPQLNNNIPMMSGGGVNPMMAGGVSPLMSGGNNPMMAGGAVPMMTGGLNPTSNNEFPQMMSGGNNPMMNSGSYPMFNAGSNPMVGGNNNFPKSVPNPTSGFPNINSSNFSNVNDLEFPSPDGGFPKHK